jgi:hypothetical protein
MKKLWQDLDDKIIFYQFEINSMIYQYYIEKIFMHRKMYDFLTHAMFSLFRSGNKEMKTYTTRKMFISILQISRN